MQTQPSRPQRSLILWIFFFLLLLVPFVPTLLAQQASQEIQQARQAADSGDWQAAAQQMANAAASQPGKSDLWEEAGHYALQAGEPRIAQTFLERAGVEKLSPQGLIDLGDTYQQGGDLARAIQSWNSALTATLEAGLDTGGILDEIYPRLFQAYRLSPDLTSGSAELRLLADRYPQEAPIQYQAGLFLAADQPDQAMDYLSQAARLDSSLARRTDRLIQSILQAQGQTIPTEPGSEPTEVSPAYLFLSSGRALAALDEWSLAAHAFERATSIQPEYAQAWAYLGEARTHIAADEQERLQGLADIQHALQIDPASLPAHLFLAYYWTRQQQYDQARQAIADAQALHPQSPLLLAEMGNILALNGNVQAAQETYAQAIALAPDDPAYLRYSIRFSLVYNYELELLALPLARQAVILDPNDSETLDLMAQVMIRLGDLSNAERFVQRSLQSQPDYAPAHLSLGTLYLMRNQLDLARLELQTVLELAPGSPSAEQAQRLLETYYPS